ncbi:LADA_0B06634g1_1 [Lachancea dasiensis]|uniref:LADA_0B06634g1_1 n=1 Tax=Lachancea dasiensis TaxID=1072105 RepID=A0A1G4ITY9_9SACH|nr:LADA_0B06634g1_1 [Lachancea dasiensis]
MRLTLAFSVYFAVSALAVPVALQKRASLGDPDILQFALTLEHLENAFYKQALSTWSVDEFVQANFTEDFYSQLKYIAHDEEGHVLFLESGLKAAGASPVAACSYNFPMTGPKEFVALAATIEGVGVSAYLGAAPYVSSKAYLTAAASILATEALHQSAARGASGAVPMANPFATPMGVNAVYSIASQFISSCPSSNTALPVKAYPGLTVTQGMPVAANTSVTFSVDGELPQSPIFVTFVSGLNVLPVEGSIADGMLSAEVPGKVSGQSYAFVTSDNSGNLTDSSILFGPAILEVTASSPTFDLSVV